MTSNRQKLLVLCGIALLAAICQWGLQEPLWAQIINSVAGGWMALVMFIDMLKKLRAGDYGVDLLAITAIVATLAVGEYWAAMVILLMLIGGDSLENYANQRAHSELSTLLDNTPRIANRLIDGKATAVDVNELKVVDQVVIKPGEQVPVDGVVVEGISSVDESTLTGESLPVNKRCGEELLSGSLNGDGRLVMKVQRRAADSQYQQLVALIEQSDQQPAHFVRLADRYTLPLYTHFVSYCGNRMVGGKRSNSICSSFSCGITVSVNFSGTGGFCFRNESELYEWDCSEDGGRDRKVGNDSFSCL